MLTILPLPQGAEKERILQSVQAAENNAAVLAMRDGEKVLGILAIDVQASTVRLLKIELPGGVDPSSPQGQMRADSLFRAAVAFGMTAGAYRLESLVPGWDAFFLSRGFQQNDEKLQCKMSQIAGMLFFYRADSSKMTKNCNAKCHKLFENATIELFSSIIM